MSTEYFNPPALDGQSQANDNQIFEDWTEQTETAIDALFVFKAWLRAWQSHAKLGELPTELFEAVIQDLRDSGLSGWLDSDRVAALRRVVCGGEL